jgi:hypothetical protein
MRQIVEEFRPDLVFILLGSNDAQAQIAPSGAAIPVGSIEWVQGYRDQAERLLSEATGAGTRVVWVGIPIVEERDRWDFYRRVNDVYRQVAQDDPLATYLDAWSLFRAKDGGYRAFARNERGLLQEMRAPDGIHFTPNYAYLGRMALRTRRVLRLPGRSLPAVARFGQVVESPTRFVARVGRRRSGGRRPYAVHLLICRRAGRRVCARELRTSMQEWNDYAGCETRDGAVGGDRCTQP